jgi:hypothetical protein
VIRWRNRRTSTGSRLAARCSRGTSANSLAHRVTIDRFPREEWDRILAVDLTGLYEVSLETSNHGCLMQ